MKERDRRKEDDDDDDAEDDDLEEFRFKKLEEFAKKALNHAVFEYFRSGSEDEFSLRSNENAFSQWHLNSWLLLLQCNDLLNSKEEKSQQQKHV